MINFKKVLVGSFILIIVFEYVIYSRKSVEENKKGNEIVAAETADTDTQKAEELLAVDSRKETVNDALPNTVEIKQKDILLKRTILKTRRVFEKKNQPAESGEVGDKDEEEEALAKDPELSSIVEEMELLSNE